VGYNSVNDNMALSSFV